MGRLTLKNICPKPGGRFYFRQKVRGKDTYIKIVPPTDPGFAAEYARLMAEEERKGPLKGTIAALVEDYRKSSEFKTIRSDITKRNYRRYLDMFVREDGHRPVKGLKPVYVRKMRDRYQDRPGTANNWLAIFKTLMDYASENDWRDDNPASRIKPLPIGEHDPWPAEVLEKALDAATPMNRLAIILGLCTGVRRADAIRVQHAWMKGGMLEFEASKNKKDVAVPIHPLLTAEIEKLPRRSLTVLYGRNGQPFTRPDALSDRIRALMSEIGEQGYSYHGLRKNAACYLKELGLDDGQIGSMLAMTEDTVRHYTKRSRALMVALKVASKVTRGDVLQLKVGRRERSR